MTDHIKIGTVTCDQEAFRPVDLVPLLGRSSRGNNLPFPTAVGQRPYAPLRDQLDVTIQWYAIGRTNQGGTAQSPGTGLYENLEYYKAAFLGQGNGSTGLTAATLYLQNGTLTSNIQVWDWSPYWTGPMTATVTTRIVVPTGEWT